MTDAKPCRPEQVGFYETREGKRAYFGIRFSEPVSKLNNPLVGLSSPKEICSWSSDGYRLGPKCPHGHDLMRHLPDCDSWDWVAPAVENWRVPTDEDAAVWPRRKCRVKSAKSGTWLDATLFVVRPDTFLALPDTASWLGGWPYCEILDTPAESSELEYLRQRVADLESHVAKEAGDFAQADEAPEPSRSDFIRELAELAKDVGSATIPAPSYRDPNEADAARLRDNGIKCQVFCTLSKTWQDASLVMIDPDGMHSAIINGQRSWFLKSWIRIPVPAVPPGPRIPTDEDIGKRVRVRASAVSDAWFEGTLVRVKNDSFRVRLDNGSSMPFGICELLEPDRPSMDPALSAPYVVTSSRKEGGQ